jgi:broad specificity phosphatase PhoE
VLRHLHLVRHGEVHNPDHLCYGDLPGFGLSRRGRLQAQEAADYLGGLGVDLLVSSPIERALETAGIIGRALRLSPVADGRLSEWRLGTRWAGTVWEALAEVFPGELEAYFSHPQDLPFSPESLAEVAVRVSGLIEDLGERHPGKSAILVSHQDPIQATRLALSGAGFAGFHESKPEHCSVLTLSAGPHWRLDTRWAPTGLGPDFPPGASH